MEQLISYLAMIVAFLATVILTKYWIRAARSAGLVGKDMNKMKRPEIPEAGGVAVIMGFVFAVLVYVFFNTFFLSTTVNFISVFALISSVLLAGFLGFIDDILGWKIGIKQWQKPILTLPAAIPLVVINAGVSRMLVPFLGSVDFGIIYPLVLIPLGVMGAANGFNFIAGHNSLEAGLGAIILATLGIAVLSRGEFWLFFISFSAVAALLGFLVFNRYPARVFPGDSLTYAIGTMIAAVAILGNAERVAIILFIPYFIEFFLKARSRMKAESFGVPDREGGLSPPTKRICSLTHVAMLLPKKMFGRKPREYDVALLLFLLELLFVIIVLLML